MRYLAAVLLGLIAAPLAAMEVDNLRLWPAPDNTRAVFDLSAPVKYEIFAIDNPPRIVVELKGANISKALAQPGPNHALLRKVRHGRMPDGTGTRVVFDVARQVEVRSSLLKPNERYGHRLLVEFAERNTTVAEKVLATPVTAPAPVSKPAIPKVATLASLETPKLLAPTVSPAAKVDLSRTHRSRDIIVAIDAGHGGEDPGAIGSHGTQEKEVTLAIARRLANEVNSIPGMRGVLTRDGDYFIPLRKRIEKAREHHADMFVSVHADAYKDPKVAGSSVYVLSSRGASSEAARWLADRENASDHIGGVTWNDKDGMLKSVLLDLSQTASMEASHTVADEVLDRLDRVGNVRKQKVQHAGFVVLKSPDIPSILVETAYLTNPSEEKKLRTADHQKKLARAIANGIRQFFETSPPPGTLMAEQRERRLAANP